ncbi:lysozyme-like [Lytechinus variegatus]|uniref:lysozyme-like n=1 Tax=Lytechinus variegatus TaxID=7654 RepID=UPI001BB0DCB9|nr:lysozyme-like [Lytechinus variegatus]
MLLFCLLFHLYFLLVSGGYPVPDDCLACICIVESSGCQMPNPICEYDVGSLSCGPYQIKKGYWTDATRSGGSLMGSWRECTASFECSEKTVQAYMTRYATTERLGETPTCEHFARIHNGGPRGHTRASTLAFWKKVNKCLP